ncbi:Uncharacterized protein APZ42_024752 [Daphnia magna]|uniref:MULE transposase domain-containing protein n=1 Tax=Daphnia magna TaxID=35525 RepID=A0A164TTE3_9CRUS|nr:Uncharacterized protein APZ42_024752 [Daphnia magna]
MTENLSDGEVEDIGDAVEYAERVGEIVNLTEIQGERKDVKLFKTELNLYHRVKRLRPEVIVGFDATIKKRMQCAQQENKPPLPRSFYEAEALLLEQLQYRSRVSTDTETAFIFLSMALLGPLRRSKQIQADRTFKTVPHLFYQLFTLHLEAYKKPFPLAYVLLSEKTLHLDNLVMEGIIGAAVEVNNDQGFACECIISDFEEAIIVALQTSFPAAETRGCWFHYGQRACREGVTVGYRSMPVIKRIIQMTIAFVLLMLIRFTPVLLPFNVKMRPIFNWSCRKLRKHCNVFTNIWQVIGWQHKPQLDSAFMARGTELTTTWSRGIVVSMRAVMDTDRISGILFISNYILYFSVHLQECGETARLDFIALSQAEDIHREALSTRVAERERLIIQRERDLEDGLIDIYEFLHQSMSSFEPAESPHELGWATELDATYRKWTKFIDRYIREAVDSEPDDEPFENQIADTSTEGIEARLRSNQRRLAVELEDSQLRESRRFEDIRRKALREQHTSIPGWNRRRSYEKLEEVMSIKYVRTMVAVGKGPHTQQVNKPQVKPEERFLEPLCDQQYYRGGARVQQVWPLCC